MRARGDAAAGDAVAVAAASRADGVPTESARAFYPGGDGDGGGVAKTPTPPAPSSHRSTAAMSCCGMLHMLARRRVSGRVVVGARGYAGAGRGRARRV